LVFATVAVLQQYLHVHYAEELYVEPATMPKWVFVLVVRVKRWINLKEDFKGKVHFSAILCH